LLMLNEMYQHPNGQVPAYEWNVGDVNPPVHAWAAFFIYLTERQRTGTGDTQFLKLAFQKLLMNFTWWVNRKDRDGRNVFEGGFLGLDNIGIFDRSAPLPTGGFMEQADGTAWMAFFCQSMLQIAVELAPEDSVYEDMAQKFIEHFLRIAGAMDRIGINADELWDEEDGFFYDLLRLPDGTAKRIKVRSIVGLLPLCASTVIAPEFMGRYPNLVGKIERFCQRNGKLIANMASPTKPGYRGRLLFSILNEKKLRQVLTRMLDEERFFGPSRYPGALTVAQRPSLRSERARRGIPRPVHASGIHEQHVRRQFQLAGSSVDAHQRTDHSRLAVALSVLRESIHHRMSYRLGCADDPLRGGERTLASA
jgi:hypothetical protein